MNISEVEAEMTAETRSETPTAENPSVTLVVTPVATGTAGEGFEAGVEVEGFSFSTQRGWYGRTQIEALGRMTLDRLETELYRARAEIGEQAALAAMIAEVLRLAGVDLAVPASQASEMRDRFKRDDEQQAELERKAALGDLLTDGIDRCQHGRHRGDVCSGCNGDSVGVLPIGTVIGHTRDGQPIHVPERGGRYVTDWTVKLDG